MRILIHSSTPECNSGYGNQVREITRRLKTAGHYVRIATKHAGLPWKLWEGVEVFEGTNRILLNEMIEAENFDYVLSYWDIWLMEDKFFPKDKWVAVVPIDTEWISGRLLESVQHTGRQIALSAHGIRELEAHGYKPMYGPCGIDTETFTIKPEARAKWRSDFMLDDETFVIGSVGLNYGDDRKGFIQLMLAFKDFLDFYPKSVLYLHTHALGAYPGTINYKKVAEKIGVAERVCWPHQMSNDIGRIDPAWLADTYNGMDVMCLPSKGEGFGLPLAEAQACGTPVVTTDTTTGPELCKTGYLIKVDRDDLHWMGVDAFRYEPKPSAILIALRQAFDDWLWAKPSFRREAVRERVLRYDWRNVWPHWEKIIEGLEHGRS